MVYKDFIKVDEGFQYSINLQYDLNKLNKINGYIPTNLSTEILMEFLKDIVSNTKDRAKVIIGPYGKGKSHLLLILSALVSLNEDAYDEDSKLTGKEVLYNLQEKLAIVNNTAKEAAEYIRNNKIKLLPIIINSSYTDLTQSFLIGLKDSLERTGLTDLAPKTYFEAIKVTLEMWNTEYPNTFNLFEKKLNKFGLNIKSFKRAIDKYDNNAYEIFKDIHPQITSGTEFNPLLKSDVVKLYDEINEKICEAGTYKGMFIIFDEFSKFLEAGVNKNTAKDIKILQDFAELSNRSGKNQIHLTCITHKAVNDYLINLPQEKIDGWRAIEGRFREIYFTSSFQQNYELIANAIKKDRNNFNRFLDKFRDEFERDISCYDELGLFKDVDDYKTRVGEGCFPLNPMSAYVLPRVSEKVAQNERTLFTFIAKDDNGSLARFINENKGSLEYLTLDWIYDYFEILLKKELFNLNVHSIWVKASSLLKKVKDDVEKKILKALAVIYIVNDFDVLAPKDNIIRMALSLRIDEYEKAINSLLDSKIIHKRLSNNFYEFLTVGSEDVKKDILTYKETKAAEIDISKTLSEVVSLGYILPKEYNDKYEMIRFFRNIYMTAEELQNVSSGENLIKYHNSDGLVIHLVYNNDVEKQSAVEKLKSLNSCRIIMCVPKKGFEKYDEVREYLAIQYLKSDVNYIKQNDMLYQSLLVYEEDLYETITKYIEQNYSIQSGNCNFYCNGELIKNITKPAHLNKKIFKICEDYFSETPIINNELINKMNPSTPIVKARSKIIQYIFEEMENENKIEFTGSGPEVTLYRVLIKNKGLDKNENISKDVKLNKILSIVDEFIRSSENSMKSFDNLYSVLLGEKYGLRLGYIPVYLALKLKQYKENIVIYYGDKEVPLTVELINTINNNPKQYSIVLESGTNEKEHYIRSLEAIFNDFKGTRKIGYNRYSNILMSMQNWIQSLPKYSREYEVIYIEDSEEKLSRDIILLRRDLLKFDINPREFLFHRIRKRILKEDSFDICLRRIEKIKNQLDNHYSIFLKTLIKRTKQIFQKGYSGELSTLLKYWYKNLSESSKNYAYDFTTNNLLNYIRTLDTHNDEAIIQELAYLITGLNIEDWNDDMFHIYIQGITNLIEATGKYKNDVVADSNGLYQLTFFAKDKKIKKAFEVEEISPLGKTLLDNIEQSIEEYADSLDINEKRNILMELIKKFM